MYCHKWICCCRRRCCCCCCCCHTILYGGDMRTCLRSLAAGSIPTMSELRHEWEPSFERWPLNIKDTSQRPLNIVSNVLTIRSLHTRWKTDWHQLSGIIHWIQQRVDYGQVWFSIGLLYRWHWRINMILYEGDMRNISVHWQQGFHRELSPQNITMTS